MDKNLWEEELDRAQDLFNIMGEEKFLSSRELCVNCLIAVIGLIKDYDADVVEKIVNKYPFLNKIELN